MQVSDGQNGRNIVFCDEEYAKRKSVQERSADLTSDERKLERCLLNPDERSAQRGDEVGSEATSFTVIPCTSRFGIEFCLGPNVEPNHLSTCAKVPLYAFDDLSPWACVAGRPTMRGQPVLQQGLLPLVQRHLVHTGCDTVPQRLDVVDLIFNR